MCMSPIDIIFLSGACELTPHPITESPPARTKRYSRYMKPTDCLKEIETCLGDVIPEFPIPMVMSGPGEAQQPTS